MSNTEYVIRKGMDRIRGRLAGLIESVGLPERQERSAIATLKALANDLEAKLIQDISNSA